MLLCLVFQEAGDKSGLASTTATTLAGAPIYNFALPLCSGIIGSNASEVFPISQLTAPLRLEILLSANDDAIVYYTAGSGATWTLVNMELEVTLVEIQTEHPIMNPERPIYISTRSHRSTTLTMYSAQSGQFTGILPFRYFSMTGLFNPNRKIEIWHLPFKELKQQLLIV